MEKNNALNLKCFIISFILMMVCFEVFPQQQIQIKSRPECTNTPTYDAHSAMVVIYAALPLSFSSNMEKQVNIVKHEANGTANYYELLFPKGARILSIKSPNYESKDLVLKLKTKEVQCYSVLDPLNIPQVLRVKIWGYHGTYNGSVFKDQANGLGVFTFDPGAPYQSISGYFVENIPEGKAQCIWMNGNSFDGIYKTGIPTEGTYRISDQSNEQINHCPECNVYEGQFNKQFEKQGKGKCFNGKELWYQGLFKDDRPTGSYQPLQRYRVLVEKEIYDSAFYILQQAVKDGYEEAYLLMGKMYKEGIVQDRNVDKSFEWISKSATLGNIEAIYLLGAMYYDGEGVSPNSSKAFELFSKAAKQAYQPAQYMLGLMYSDGEGVEENAEKAAEWYQKAVANSDTE